MAHKYYTDLFPHIHLRTLLSPSQGWLTLFFDQAKIRTRGNRACIHYFSNGDAQKSDIEEFERIFSNIDTLNCTAFIFDFDNCDELYDLFQNLPPETDTFAFFACSKGQKLVRTPDLPNDLFTSCMITTPRTVLLWHSWHYYCFKNGPLKPLSPLFVEEEELDSEEAKQIFSHVKTVINSTVESIAIQVLDHETFLRFFRTDQVICQLTINFIMACRVLSFFNITPVSFPSIPNSIIQHKLWQTLELRLDAELYQLQQQEIPNNISYTHFMEQILLTIRTAIDIVSPENPFVPQISYFPSILSPEFPQQIVSEACSILALYLDISTEAIRMVLCFPIIKPLFRILIEKPFNDFDYNPLFFCLCKLMAYIKTSKDIHVENIQLFFDTNIFPLLSSQNSKLVVTFCVLFLNGSTAHVNEFVKSNWRPFVLTLLKDKDKDTRIWALLLISILSQNIKSDFESDNIFQEICQLINYNLPEERLVSIYCLTQFLVDYESTSLQENILNLIYNQKEDYCYLIRLQIISTISYYFHKHFELFFTPTTEVSQQLHKLIVLYLNDSHPLVINRMEKLIEAISTYELDAIIQPTYVIEFYYSLLLKSIKHILIEAIDLPYSLTIKTNETKERNNEIKHMNNNNNNNNNNNLKLTSIYTHSYDITSNFITLPMNSEFIFGDSMGYININNWNNNKILLQYKTEQKLPINYIKYINNFSYPLIFTTNFNNVLSSYSINNNYELKLMCSFDLPKTKNNLKFDVEQNYGNLLFYEPLNSNLMLFDLRSMKLLQEIELDGTLIHSAYCINYSNSLIGICTENFYLLDLRTKEKVISKTLRDKPFDFRVVDPLEPSFHICMENGKINTFDIRSIEVARKKFVPSFQNKVDIMAFDSHHNKCNCVIGHNSGFACIDLLNQKQMNFPNVMKSKQSINAVEQCLFHSSALSLNVLNGKREIILLEEHEI